MGAGAEGLNEFHARARRAGEFYREVDGYRAAFPDDAVKWLMSHGLDTQSRPRFAADSDAIKRICERYGLKQAAVAGACGVGPSTVSAWAKEPHKAKPRHVREIIDLAERLGRGGESAQTFNEFVAGLLDVPSRASGELTANEDRAEDIAGIADACWYLTDAQLSALTEVVRSMLLANGEDGDVLTSRAGEIDSVWGLIRER